MCLCMFGKVNLCSFKKADLIKYILDDPFIKRRSNTLEEQYTDLSLFLLKQHVRLHSQLKMKFEYSS